MIDRFILDFSKYAVSHVYDIYALLAGTISFVATLLLRKRLKRFGEVMDLLFTIILSLVLYYYFTESSMLIRFNWKYFVLAVMDALGEMYILRAFLKGKKQVVTTAVIFTSPALLTAWKARSRRSLPTLTSSRPITWTSRATSLTSWKTTAFIFEREEHDRC